MCRKKHLIKKEKPLSTRLAYVVTAVAAQKVPALLWLFLYHTSVGSVSVLFVVRSTVSKIVQLKKGHS